MMEVSMSPKVTQRKRRLFTPEFKAEAVRLVRDSGKTVAKVARELDLTATCLRAWVNQAAVDEKSTGEGALTTDERAELTRLRRELRSVEQERDFLKNSREPRRMLTESLGLLARNSLSRSVTGPRRSGRPLFGASSPLKNMARGWLRTCDW